MKIRDQIAGSLVLITAVTGVGGALAYAKYSQIKKKPPAPPEMPLAVHASPVTEVTFRHKLLSSVQCSPNVRS